MRLSLRGHGNAPARSWDELALHEARSPGVSTPPSVRPGVILGVVIATALRFMHILQTCLCPTACPGFTPR